MKTANLDLYFHRLTVLCLLLLTTGVAVEAVFHAGRWVAKKPVVVAEVAR